MIALPARGADERPRIGLVLGGGGAKGGAHVGVLRVLEELRIPVDVIAGTSMGAVVGGLYASGLSADELDALVHDLDWTALFQDKTRRRDLSFRRKQDDRNFLSKFHLGFKDWRFQVPSGFIQGQKMEQELAVLTLPVATVRDFDRLPIPFRAVATDLETGNAVVLGAGDLYLAIRASLAIPGIFATVELDDKLLVDGGLSMNLPVQVAQAMGADVIIAVDLSVPLKDRSVLGSAFAVSGQIVASEIHHNTAEQLARLREGDVLIHPESGVGTVEFDRIVDAAEAGEEAAWDAAPALRALSVDESAWQAHLAARWRPDRSPPVIDALRIENDSRLADATIRAHLGVRLGEPLDVHALRRDIDKLFGLDMFDRVQFEVNALAGESPAAPTPENELVVRVEARETGRTRIRFGLNLETDFESQSLFNIGSSIVRLPVNGLGGEWRTTLQVGEDPEIITEFWQPVDRHSRWFVAPRGGFEAGNIDLFLDGQDIVTYRAWNLFGELGVGRQLGQWGEVRVGLRGEKQRARRVVGLDIFPSLERTEGEAFLRASIDTLDSDRFPRNGVLAESEFTFGFESLGADEDYQSVAANFSLAHSFGPHTLLLEGQVATALENGRELGRLYPLGGFLRLSGLHPNELIGPHALLLRMRAYRRLLQLGVLSFQLPLYAGLSVEGGNVWEEDPFDFGDMRVGGSVWLAADTFFSPLYLAYGYTNPDRHAVYLFMGQTF